MMEMLGFPNIKNDSTMDEKEKDDKIIEFLDEQLILRSDSPFLNLKYFSKYRSQGGGFKLSVDGVHNLPNSKSYYFVLYSMNPPSLFYGDEPEQAGLRVNSFYDWEKSTKNTIFFNEGYVRYGEVEFDPTLSIVVDLRRGKFKDMGPPEIEKIGWSIVPIFTPDGYVNSNIAQIPVFSGTPTQELLKDL